ncbi:unnamed protein product [Clonostachys rosea]|uniref:FAD-binding domain-containing protein n=1 Tax=Bionectria ochroleuca TaxID=29856 RepID=A0ABY6UPK8_BIOOC|nr:unnamed protein product [Clonostachys rosea]
MAIPSTSPAQTTEMVFSSNGLSKSTNSTSSNNGIFDACVVGAGPAGLMLSVILARLGLNIKVLDERPDQTTVGRADGIQPKTIETLQMLRLGDELFQTGVKVFDICMWRGSPAGLQRMGRECHYPASTLDVLHPFILLCHQGMVEGMLIDDLRQSGTEVSRSHIFETFSQESASGPLKITCASPKDSKDGILSEFLVGCDGARSRVREAIPDTYSTGTPHNSVWGVLDGELETDFPDIWSKTVVFSEEHGSILMIPRERNMTRFYIEMKTSSSSKELGQEYVMEQARRILNPYKVEWLSVEWFGKYSVSQRVAASFSDPEKRAFIAGDASHTHSPKAAQGMNTSVHDSWNLGWKLNLVSRGLASKDVLLGSYEDERKKIAHDLINFDYEHANEIAGGDAKRLAENFRTNIRFISGVGVEYGPGVLNSGSAVGILKPGSNLPPGKVTRYIDANPIDIQLDIPMLGQFRVYVVVPNLDSSAQADFLRKFSEAVSSGSSLISRASAAAQKSYSEKPRAKRIKDVYFRPERYTTVSQLITFSLLTATDKSNFEIANLPRIFSQSPWTIYLDDVPQLDTQGKPCIQKWLGDLGSDKVSVINVRPDGYVGSVETFDINTGNAGDAAAAWLESYYEAFLQL